MLRPAALEGFDTDAAPGIGRNRLCRAGESGKMGLTAAGDAAVGLL